MGTSGHPTLIIFASVCTLFSHSTTFINAHKLGWEVIHKHNNITSAHSIQYNTIQHNTIQYNTIQYNTIQYNTIQYNTSLMSKGSERLKRIITTFVIGCILKYNSRNQFYCRKFPQSQKSQLNQDEALTKLQNNMPYVKYKNIVIQRAINF